MILHNKEEEIRINEKEGGIVGIHSQLGLDSMRQSKQEVGTN